MKKIIKAEEQWRNEMNTLINEYYDCDSCCKDLGAIDDNECYQYYNNVRSFVFTKVGDVFKKIEFTDVSAEYLLISNWRKLNPLEDWYDKEHVLSFLLDREHGYDVSTYIDIVELIWMGIYTDGDMIHVTEYKDLEVEVSTEEIEAIRQEIVERCKGHSIEEIRDMFSAYNMDVYGKGSFDFIYDGFIFSIHNTDNDNAEGEWFLSCIVCDECGNDSDSFVTTTLPIPPKEIKLDISDTLAPQMDAKPEEKKSLNVEDFLEHIASIFEEGHRVICVEFDGDQYVINGLFDNQDIIIHTYRVDTMELVDRYFVVGAHERYEAEAELFYESLVGRFVKDKKIGGSWYMTDKQFKFLKEA